MSEDDVGGSIDTGVSGSESLMGSNATLIAMGAAQMAQLAIKLRAMVDLIDLELLKEHQHVHRFHKHSSCGGHCNSAGIELEMFLNNALFVQSGGRFFANAHHNTASSLLLNEMIHKQDLDGNGLIYGVDFMIDLDDPKIPPAIKNVKNNPFFHPAVPPESFFGNSYPNTEPSLEIGQDDLFFDYQNNDTSVNDRSPKVLKRKLKIISWDEYYAGIDEYYREYAVI